MVRDIPGISREQTSTYHDGVAPLAGAWIETLIRTVLGDTKLIVAPLGARGLKLVHHAVAVARRRRAPRVGDGERSLVAVERDLRERPFKGDNAARRLDGQHRAFVVFNGLSKIRVAGSPPERNMASEGIARYGKQMRGRLAAFFDVSLRRRTTGCVRREVGHGRNRARRLRVASRRPGLRPWRPLTR